eukprot:5650391-Amphidinium_carterae.1
MINTRSRLTLSPLQTAIGLDAIRQGRVPVEQSRRVGDHHCYTSAGHSLQLLIALFSAEAELYAMGQATIEAQHIKQVIQEMAIPKLSRNINYDQYVNQHGQLSRQSSSL